MIIIKYLWLKYFLALLYLVVWSIIEENVMIVYLITIKNAKEIAEDIPHP